MIRKWILHLMVLLPALVCSFAAQGQTASSVESTEGQRNLWPNDIMIVIDNSGSMKKNDPDFLTQEVVANFLGDLGDDTRLGMVIFDREARLVEPLGDRSGQLARATFLKSLEKVDYTGQLSDTPVAVERAVYSLKRNARPDAQKVIVLLTDGIVDTGDKLRDIEKEKWLKEALTDESRQAGIRIFGIAFTEAADFSLIQTLAIRTNGEYYRAFSVEDIHQTFNALQKSLTSAPRAPAEDAEDQPKTKAASAQPIETAEPKISIDQAPEPSFQTAPVSTPSPTAESPQPAAIVEKPFLQNKTFLIPFAVSLVIIILLGIILVMLISNRRTAGQPSKSPLSGPVHHGKLSLIPRAELVDVKNITDRQTIPLSGRITRVGRDSNNDIAISQNTVSSLHATIEYRDGFFYLEDQRSKNKTRLNGIPVAPNAPKKLKNGDEIMFNVYKFIFLLPDQIPAGETVMDFREDAETVVMKKGEMDDISADLPGLGDIPQAMLIDMKNVTGKKSFAIEKLKFKIGRGVHNELAIDETSISGSHAIIDFKDGAFYLEDQRSTNKTRINGEPISPYMPKKLKSGDEIMFDVFKFIFLLERQLPTGETGRRWSNG